jgi:hypothetical protein
MTEVDELDIKKGKALLTARIDSKSSAHDGMPLKVVADPTRLYYDEPYAQFRRLYPALRPLERV